MKVSKNIIKTGLFASQYNLSKLLKKMGNIQDNIKVINIVGTNGKGSVINYLAKQMVSKYNKVGLFISPAFLYHNERIKINGIDISDSDLKRFLKITKPFLKKYQLTFFEVWVLIAILYFNEQQVDIAIIEAGIGGLHDATNVFNNQVLVGLTALGLDHTEILGNDIQQIAYQKLAIAKPNVPIFTSCSNLQYKDIIEKSISNKIVFASLYQQANVEYQKDNIGLVIAILNHLNIVIDETIFVNSPCLGRFTILNSNPYFIIDGAHNEHGIVNLIDTVKKVKTDRWTVLYASSYKKNSWEILNTLCSEFDNVYITNFKHQMSWQIKKINYNNKIGNWKKFISNNLNNNLLICGSLYFIPLVYEYYQQLLKKGCVALSITL